MYKRIRKLPPVCLCIALARLLTGGLRLTKDNVGVEVRNENGKVYRVFRNIKTSRQISTNGSYVFVVSFKFARLSHGANKVASFIPMLLIAGFPGFIQKMYAVNDETDYWQGMYEWKSKHHLANYKKSFVFRMMNKRALPESMNMHAYEYLKLSEYIREYKNIKKAY